MKSRFTLLVTLLFAFVMIAPAQQVSGSRLSRVAGVYNAAAYGQWQAKISVGSASTGAVTYTLASGTVTLPDGSVIVPYATSAPLLLGSGANQETATPSAVSGCVKGGQPNTCQITISVSNAHGQGDIIQSGTAGLQEAVNDADVNGVDGIVVIDGAWTKLGGTNTILTTNVTAKTGVAVNDYRGTGAVFYGKTSTSYAAVLSIGAASWSSAKVLSLGTAGSVVGEIDFLNATSGSIALKPVTGALGTVSLLLPAASDTLVGKATTDILTNKTLTSAVVTTAGLGFTNATSGTITVAPPTGALGTVTNTLPAITGGLVPGFSCGATGSGNQTCSPAAVTGIFHLYTGHSTLSGSAATITFPVAFAATTSFECVANDITTRANPVQMIPASTTTATITNTTGATDVIQWICAGQ